MTAAEVHGQIDLDAKRALFRGTLILWVVLLFLLIPRYQDLAPDDFYITFRYAANLAAGDGFVYNPGERVFGLSNPGFGLLLAGLRWLTGGEIPLISTTLGGLSLFALVTVLLIEGRRRNYLGAAALGGTLVLSSSYLWSALGGAGSLTLALLAAAAAASRRYPATAGLLAGFAVGCRPDALAGAGLVALLRAAQDHRIPWRYTMALLLSLGLGVLAAWAYFDTALPVTLSSKQVLADLQKETGLGFWSAALLHWQRHGGLFAFLLGFFGALGHLPLLRQGGPAARLLVLYSFTLAIAYPLLGVPFFNWYVIPNVVAVLFAAPFLTCALGRLLPPRTGTAAIDHAVAVLFSLALLAPVLEPFGAATLDIHRRARLPGRMAAYRQAAEWIHDHTGLHERIALTEIGIVGFYSQRPIYDLMGLVTPEVLPQTKRGQLPGAVRRQAPELVLWHGQRSRLARLQHAPWFQKNYRLVARFPTDPEEQEVVVYRRRDLLPPSQLPAEASQPAT